MANNFEIDSLIEDLASFSSVKRFSANFISERLGVSEEEVYNRLEFAINDGKIIRKFEISCSECSNEKIVVDDYKPYFGKLLDCYHCGENFEVDFDNIYPVYEISDEFRKYVKKNSIKPSLTIKKSITQFNVGIA